MAAPTTTPYSLKPQLNDATLLYNSFESSNVIIMFGTHDVFPGMFLLDEGFISVAHFALSCGKMF